RRITIPTLPADEFPMPSAVGDPVVQYRGRGLADAVSRAAPMASTNDHLFHLCGVALYGKHAVASDGAFGCEVMVDGLDAPDDGSIILPRSILSLISGEVDLSCDGKLAEIAMDGRLLVTRLVDGTFPDYRRVMPEDAPDVASFSASTLLASVRAAVATIPENNGRLAVLRSNGTSVSLTARDGTFDDAIGADVARDFAVGINVAKLADVLEAFGDAEVQWSGDDVSKPQMFVAGSVRCVLMPVRIAL
ncbi:MAG TPA: DNA polymerase III subunit beta, partial [Terrimesophilobacter sp.]|nr:DNA polymerase III subunit beta [Terrimesophilobacter sp.]